MSIKELYRDDLLNRYASHTFTETTIDSMTLVEFKDGGSVVIGASKALISDDAYKTIREDLIGTSGDTILSLTGSQRDALTGSAHGTEIHNIDTGNMDCFHEGEWTPSDSNTVEDGITASTTQTQGQQPLTEKLNTVSTVANSNDVVTMQAAVPGTIAYISNSGANTLQVYPASGDNFNGLSADASITISASGMKVFFSTNTNEWAYS